MEMRNLSSLSFTMLTLAIFLVPVSVVCEVILSPIALHLERISPLNQSLHHPFVRARDRLRHSWILQQSDGEGEGVVNFPLESSADPSIFGSYFTRVKLGSIQKEFKVLIDAESDIPWIACNTCIICPRTNRNGPGPPKPCIGFVKARDNKTILEELILKDSIVVYDLAHQRIGCAPYNCSRFININVAGENVAVERKLSICSLLIQFMVTIATTV